MASRRLTVEQAQAHLDSGADGAVWALNYDPNGIPGDWTGMQAGDELVDQYGPFILTTEGEDEPIDATVLTLDEQIAYETDRMENASDLEIDKEQAKSHLIELIARKGTDGALNALGAIQSRLEAFEASVANDGMSDEMAVAVNVLEHFILQVAEHGSTDLEWGEPGECIERIQNDANIHEALGLGEQYGDEDYTRGESWESIAKRAKDAGLGRHYGDPHCVWCLQGD